MRMKEENIYKVTLIDGPTTAIMPIKAYDHDHAMRIARNMGLGRVVKVEFACEDNSNSNINYDKLTPYDKKRLEGTGCPPSP